MSRGLGPDTSWRPPGPGAPTEVSIEVRIASRGPGPLERRRPPGRAGQRVDVTVLPVGTASCARSFNSLAPGRASSESGGAGTVPAPPDSEEAPPDSEEVP